MAKRRRLQYRAMCAGLVWLLGAFGVAWAQQDAAQGGGLWVAPNLIPKLSDTPMSVPAQSLPQFTDGKPVIALVSALGGQLSYIRARYATGSHRDPYARQTLPIPDRSLDAIVLRGLERVISRREPDTHRIYLRLNPLMLDGVLPQDREAQALGQLTAQLARWPEHKSWHRIVIVTPHFLLSERAGLASKLQGVGLYAQNLDNITEYEVVEPDGRAGVSQRNRYLAVFFYARVWILDAASLQVIDSQPWYFDEKIHNSQSDALDVAQSVSPELLASRLESFVEQSSDAALTRTLGGVVEGKPLRPVRPGAPRDPAR